ncbi:Acyl-CoA:lysophosphatidylglycerol acyltransferase 1 [Blattella germanica]|nr:Acyl-CoA:lysophosphatidylglycerol acyltransferase 1 [Blattella germanica]
MNHTQVPRDHEAMTKWLYDRFVEKEKLLDAYYKTGKFPTEGFCASPVPPQEVSQDCLRFAILHLFFITSSYIHFRLISYVVSYFWY